MKKTALVCCVLLLLLVGMFQFYGLARANPLPPDWTNPKITITIHSPQNETDNNLPVLVNFTAQCSPQFRLVTGQYWVESFFYVLDEQSMSSSGTKFTEIQPTRPYPTDEGYHYIDYCGQAYLTNVNAGSHSITVYYGVLVNVNSPNEMIVYNESWSSASHFYVTMDTPTLSPSLSSLPTLTPTAAPEIASEPEPFPTTIAIGSAIAVVAVVGLGLLVYLKKRRATPH
jgi:hypothetical protein